MEPDRPTRLLIVRTGAMGDILHGLPAVTALKALHPDWHIAWAVEPRWRALLEGPGQVVDSIHRVPTRRWKQRPFAPSTLREILQLRRNLRAAHYDVCVDLQGSIRSALIGRLASAPRFLGPANPRERPAQLLYSQRINSLAKHVIQHACDLLSPLAGKPLHPSPVRLPTDPAAEAWASQLAGNNPFVFIATTAGWGAKQWPADCYAELTHALHAHGLRVLINASRDPLEPPSSVIPFSELAPCSIPQLIALTRRASLVIGGDTGPVHLAAALRTPVIALFGPTDPLRNGPSFPAARAIILRHPSSRVDHRRHAHTETGLLKITVAEVLTAALNALES